MINKILVATDLSDKSEMVLKRAFLLAKEWSSKLHILHVVKRSFIDSFILGNDKLTAEKQAENLLKRKIRSYFDGNLNVQYKVVSGNSTVEILTLIGKEKIDLVVLGAHGDHAFHNWYIGSTAENVIRHSICPILIVKNEPVQHYHKVIAAVDFSETSKNALEFSAKLVPNADSTLLHVANPWYEEALLTNNIQQEKVKILLDEMTFELMEKMNTFIKNCTLPEKFHLAVKTGYPPKIINEFATEIGCDLIITGIRGQSNLHYALMGSIANHILHEVNIDILMIPPPAN